MDTGTDMEAKRKRKQNGHGHGNGYGLGIGEVFLRIYSIQHYSPYRVEWIT
jgi:hypothetical protein